jgi:hypothetical protein
MTKQSEQSEMEQLQDQIAQLQREVGRLTGSYKSSAEPEEQTDYVERGSDKHAGMLGLKKATDSDSPKLGGWALEDIVSYGPTVSPQFLDGMLRGKVNELSMEIPETQSDDPLAAHFAPAMWQPGMRLAQIVE